MRTCDLEVVGLSWSDRVGGPGVVTYAIVGPVTSVAVCSADWTSECGSARVMGVGFGWLLNRCYFVSG